MKRKVVTLVLWLAFPLVLQAQVGITGYLQTDNRYGVQGEKGYTWNENRLGLKLEGNPSEKLHYYSELRIRGFGFPRAGTSADLQRLEKDKVYPWALELREGYVDLYSFLLKNLDLRIGRQRIVWGTADKLNPTDNLNPDDLEDIFNFGEKLGTNALQATYYLGDYTLSGVFIPVFTPAILPRARWASAFAPPVTLLPGMSLRNISDHIILPKANLSESSMFACKLTTNILDYDVSLSYFHGRDDLPLAAGASLTPVNALGAVDVSSNLIYPKIQVFGTDMAGSIGSVGVWAEGAVTLPEKVMLTSSLVTPFGVMTRTSTALDDKPYFKYVVGGDYTFKNGIYINAQYLHGFIHERGSDDLHDYLVCRLEKTFLNDQLKISPLSGAVSFNDWSEVKNSYGFVAAPEIDYYPSDDIELIMGAFILDGEGPSLFSRVKDNDEVYLKVKVSF